MKSDKETRLEVAKSIIEKMIMERERDSLRQIFDMLRDMGY